MSIHLPELTPKQIATWIEAAAENAGQTTNEHQEVDRSRSTEPPLPASFDFAEIRQALSRACAKNDVPTIKQLRRLRRNQGAVNQSLIDSLGGTITVVESLVAELRRMGAEIAELHAAVGERHRDSRASEANGGRSNNGYGSGRNGERLSADATAAAMR